MHVGHPYIPLFKLDDLLVTTGGITRKKTKQKDVGMRLYLIVLPTGVPALS